MTNVGHETDSKATSSHVYYLEYGEFFLLTVCELEGYSNVQFKSIFRPPFQDLRAYNWDAICNFSLLEKPEVIPE